MSDTVTLGVLSRNRLGLLRRCVTSAFATAGLDLKVAIAFDDDFTSYECCPDWPWATRMLLRPRHYYVRAANAWFNECKQRLPDFGYFMLVDDDVEFLRPNWAVDLLEIHRKSFPDKNGVVSATSPHDCAEVFSHKDFIDEHLNGMIRDPVYLQYYSDTDSLQKLRKNGHFKCAIPDPSAPYLLHRRTETSMDMAAIKILDFHVFKQRAAEHGWSFHDYQRPTNDDPVAQ